MGLVIAREDRPGVREIRLSSPETANSLTSEMVGELEAALHAAGADASVKVVVLAGLPEVFCAGADRALLAALASGDAHPADIHLARHVLDVPVPVIAAMAGSAIGGGLALGLAADMTIIALESRYGASFMNMGFTPGMGMTRLLEQVMSPAQARELLYGGEPIRGANLARRAGFNDVLPRPEVEPRALALAARIAEKPAAALRLLKRALSLERRRELELTHTVESLMHELCFARPETRTLIEEHFR